MGGLTAGELVQSMKEAMVARAQKRKWIDFVGSLLVGAATQPLALLASPDTGLVSLPAATDNPEQVVAQLGGRSARARMALNAGIDAERLGDYDKAASLYHEAQSRANDLTPEERRELERRIAANTLALQAQREAREQLGLADSAFQHGRPAEAAALLKKVTAKELYLSPADKQRFQTLCQRMHVPPGTSPTLLSTNTEKARALVRQGREALGRGDVAQARKCAEQASALNADLSWSEDNPVRLLEDIARMDGNRAAPAGEAGPSPAAPIKTKEEALALLKQGREQLAKGQLEEANKTAARLRAARHIHWGLFFEDTPDKFQADVDRARSQRDKHQSVELLAEARRRFEKKDYDSAEKLAYEARTKHGPYSIWDLGDRPDKLLADIQVARQKERRVKLPEPPTTPRQVADLSRGPLAQNNNAVASNNPAPSVNASGIVQTSQIQQMSQHSQGNGTPAAAPYAANNPQPSSPYLANQPIDNGKTVYPPTVQTTYQPTAQTQTTYPPAAPAKDGQMRARQLIAEAKMLQQQNRLLEARDKIAEAQQLGVSSRPGEETPNQVYQQLVFQARQRIDSLVHQANETLRYGTQAPMVRCQGAERDLSQARQLAVAFGLDLQPINAAMQMVNQLRGGGTTLVRAE